MTIREVLLDEHVFENPRNFDPKRWLPSNPDCEKINRYFVPFGRGNRMWCIGVK